MNQRVQKGFTSHEILVGGDTNENIPSNPSHHNYRNSGGHSEMEMLITNQNATVEKSSDMHQNQENSHTAHDTYAPEATHHNTES